MNNDFLNFKMMMIYINEAQKLRLEEFFEEINFHLYAVQRKVETVWNPELKHKNSNIWPGTDCIFLLTLPEDKVEDMLILLKTFRMSLPKRVAMSVGIIPMERVIPRVYDDNIPVNEELLERLNKKHLK